MTVTEVSSELDLQALCASHGGLTVVLLWAPWHEPSVHLTKVLEVMAAEQRSVRFGRANTDVCPALSTSLGANQVPFVAFFDPRGKKIDSLAGADPPKLVQKVKALSSRTFDSVVCGGAAAGGGCAAKGGEQDLNSKLRSLINASPVMLFMKGSKVEPFCGFSKKAVALLNKHEAEYATFDILQDDEVRQGLKEYSNWKTYPQLYINGKLVGGLDIMQEMDEDGSLAASLPKPAAGEEDLNARLKKLVNSAPVMLFMKGNKETPFCGFSKTAVALLNSHNIDYQTFDILKDEEVRQGLKDYANWKTYPQLYVNGELLGGLDIIKEMEEDGSLLAAIPDSAKGKAVSARDRAAAPAARTGNSRRPRRSSPSALTGPSCARTETSSGAASEQKK
eukprot:CAMPEP_0170387538 /NCGR_PEP_ID=MMETSP0117_2-20130122/17611_1 /TAXON_ID=400756 /ORGANISM="Durinskia baltica, Strain CSIRO CS-38" /LENGTH=391 /DNA_ID=CAMNT_0010643413 /DNA_START=56 /DNA_END=1227 /DNA_ORIENTATION=-